MSQARWDSRLKTFWLFGLLEQAFSRGNNTAPPPHHPATPSATLAWREAGVRPPAPDTRRRAGEERDLRRFAEVLRWTHRSGQAKKENPIAKKTFAKEPRGGGLGVVFTHTRAREGGQDRAPTYPSYVPVIMLGVVAEPLLHVFIRRERPAFLVLRWLSPRWDIPRIPPLRLEALGVDPAPTPASPPAVAAAAAAAGGLVRIGAQAVFVVDAVIVGIVVVVNRCFFFPATTTPPPWTLSTRTFGALNASRITTPRYSSASSCVITLDSRASLSDCRRARTSAVRPEAMAGARGKMEGARDARDHSDIPVRCVAGR